ncbi:MAG: hypothetical protein ACXVEF_35690 [Polyangiales bacterium]
MQLVQQPAQGIGDPEIEISNLADEPLAVEISGPQNLHVDVPGSEARKIKIPAGNYVFRVTVDGVPNDQPFSFARDYRYLFTLKLIMEMDDPRFAGKGFECFEMKDKPVYSVCTRKHDACEIARKRVPSDLKIGECAHRAEMFFFRAKTKDGKPTALFVPTAPECDAIRKLYIDQKVGSDVSACEAGK